MSRRAVAVLVMSVAAVVFATTAVRALWYAPSLQVPVANAKMAPHGIVPERIRIPSLSIDAHVESLGVNARDQMVMPSYFTDAGWYTYGPAPGTAGAAVIYGHLNNGLGLDGAFARLGRIRIGQRITLVDASGTQESFTVTATSSYPYQAVPLSTLARTKTPELLLITCAGHWVYDRQEGMTYDRRLVVTAQASG